MIHIIIMILMTLMTMMTMMTIMLLWRWTNYWLRVTAIESGHMSRQVKVVMEMANMMENLYFGDGNEYVYVFHKGAKGWWGHKEECSSQTSKVQIIFSIITTIFIVITTTILIIIIIVIIMIIMIRNRGGEEEVKDTGSRPRARKNYQNLNQVIMSKMMIKVTLYQWHYPPDIILAR